MSERPDYKVYRSRPRLLPGRNDGTSSLDELREATPRRDGRRREPPGGNGRPAPYGRRRRRFFRRPTLPRVIAGFLFGVVLWLGISFVAFLVSSITAPHATNAAEQALDPGGSGLTSPTVTLVLGSDARPKGSKEPGASSISERADSIMLLRSGGGVARKLSIPRDTLVTIPGHGLSRINASYAYGGAALTIQTIKQYLGIPINHVIEVNFENFPKLIDAMGGITYKGPCVISYINGGRRNGGVTLRLRRGEHHLNGKKALALARTRKNVCNPAEDDRARVRRQQQILSAMRARVMSPAGFARAPWIGWETPRAIRTDMSGTTLVGFLTGMGLSGNAPTAVLRAEPTGTGALTVTEADRQAAVRQFMSG
jgi:LCP family protein required for cell wall assembly